jgi:hypothetical protein
VLFHVSEETGIDRFDPRSAAAGGEALVWAIDEARLRNYLVPRDCPRVAYYAGPRTTAADIERFLGASSAVLAIERDWFERLRSCRLVCYRLPPHTFACIDECAGYFVSREPVTPVRVESIEDPLAALLHRGVDVRVMRSLWFLHDAVITSSLQFSMIRMRNARARSVA